MKTNFKIYLLLLPLLSLPRLAHAQGTTFTYQGRLNDGGPATGLYDLRFTVYDAPGGVTATAIGSTVDVNDLGVTNGLFTVMLDPGANVFTGAARWLNIGVRAGASLGVYTDLTPRQPLTATPYALYALTPAGPQGIQGPKGNPGEVGATGSTGPQGPSGPTGATGTAGPTGPQGPAGSADAWSRTGNAGTTAGVNFIGTTDSQPLEFKVNGTRVLRLEPRGRGPNIIGGYSDNSVSGGNPIDGATISGGGAGGYANRVSGHYGTVGGGRGNTSSEGGTVGGGEENTSDGGWSTVGGGHLNGASGQYSTTPGGFGNSAAGWGSFAAGLNAKANHDRSFVWSSRLTFPASPSFAESRFHIHADNGLSVDYYGVRPDGGGTRWIVIGSTSGGQAISTSMGAWLSDGGAWNNASDRNRKDGFAPVNPREVLDKVAALPIQTWHYTNETAEIRHLGPVAQDFRAAFGLGSDDKSISTVDAAGVALAAIQGLNRKVDEKDAQIRNLQTRLEKLEQILASQLNPHERK